MKIIKGHYYKLVNNSGLEFIFQATDKKGEGWIIDVVRTSAKTFDMSKKGFYVTMSDDTVLTSDNIVELDDGEILAVKL